MKFFGKIICVSFCLFVWSVKGYGALDCTGCASCDDSKLQGWGLGESSTIGSCSEWESSSESESLSEESDSDDGAVIHINVVHQGTPCVSQAEHLDPRGGEVPLLSPENHGGSEKSEEIGSEGVVVCQNYTTPILWADVIRAFEYKKIWIRDGLVTFSHYAKHGRTYDAFHDPRYLDKEFCEQAERMIDRINVYYEHIKVLEENLAERFVAFGLNINDPVDEGVFPDFWFIMERWVFRFILKEDEITRIRGPLYLWLKSRHACLEEVHVNGGWKKVSGLRAKDWTLTTVR